MSDRLVRLLFATTVLCAASLVFLVQPMVAKQLLPRFGGTPNVWNATVLFFQVALLVGYAIAHVSLDRLGPRRQTWLQLALAAATVPLLPLAISSTGPGATADHPALAIAVLLAAGVGIPYLAVTTVSPALQRWYASLGMSDSADPYHLYAASNAGSLIGLLAFPFLLEPRLSAVGQARTWSIVFAVFAAGLVCCAVVVRRRAGVEPRHQDAPPQLPHVDPAAADEDAGGHIGRLRALRWVLVAAIPSALMLGVTTFVTTDVASAPLLWVVPLSLYLASFMLTFGRRLRIGVGVAGWLAVASIVAVLLVEVRRIEVGDLGRVLLHLGAMFAAALLAHAALYADRPSARHLTAFYLLLSVGGAIGGMFTALVAPAAFNAIYEYPLLLALVLVVRPGSSFVARHGGRGAIVAIGELVVAAALLFVLLEDVTAHGIGLRWAGWGGLVVIGAGLALLATRRWGLVLVVAVTFLALALDAPDQLYAERNFYGTVRVIETPSTHRMLHGTTLHGIQMTRSGLEREPTSYYTLDGPVGDAFGQLQRDEPFVDVGIVGLGSGALLAYERPWQRFTFFEIDPAVIEAARDPDLFTWMSDSEVRVDVVEGDARLQVAARDAEPFDLLVLDAYSSDAVPVHLLTVEAFETWIDATADDAVVLLHVSSRHLELSPVVADNVAKLGLVAIHRVDAELNEDQRRVWGSASHWIAIARDEADFEGLDGVDGWEPLDDGVASDAWTDDFSDVVGAIRWMPDALR